MRLTSHPIMTGLTLVAVVSLLVTSCGQDETAEPDPAPAGDGGGESAVTVAGFAFEPVTLTVATGTTVVWTNEDSTLHTVTPGDADAGFGGSLDTSGSTVEAVFDTAGTFEYFCAIHTSMTGSITVTG